MLRTLYTRLAATLLGLLLVTGLIFFVANLATTRAYLREFNQELHRNLARNLVKEALLLEEGRLNEEALEHVFHNLMVVNPAIEVYLLDPQGKILAFSAPEGHVKRSRVDLAPVGRFLGGEDALPILGDDPRDAKGAKVFSAAPIEAGGALQGYLYIVLGGEIYDSMVGMVQGSYILRTGLGGLAAALALTLAAGLLVFALLTRRLRALDRALARFQRSGFQEPVELAAGAEGKPGDEIDRLTKTFDHMQHRIREQLEQLERTDRLRREMVANVSHDLRTPLTSLRGYLDTLLLKDDSLNPEEKRRYLETAVQHSERLARLISELFDLAKLDAQEVELQWERFALGELVQDLVQEFRLAAQQKNVRLETEVHEGSGMARADVGLISRVLENLLDNAVRHTPPGGRVTVSLDDRRGSVTVRVADTGSGIAADDLPHVFDRFYRAAESRQVDPSGTGLGLAIAKRILDLHGSTIRVDSTPGAGTVVSFDLAA